MINNNLLSNKIRCIYCNNEHKFSPFNVSHEIRLDIKQPILRKDNNIYLTYISCNNDINRAITNKKIELDDINDNDIVYWGYGSDIFTNNNGLMTLLAKRLENINDETIKGLLKYILCYKWWDTFYLYIDKYNFIIDEKAYDRNINLLNTINRYFKLIKDNINIDYKYEHYNILVKKLGELIKRYNENKLYESVKNQSNKVDKELEYLKKMEELEIINMKINKIETFEEQFILSLNKTRKTNNIKFLATINPNEQIIADMIIRLGECSKLNVIIDNIDKMNKIDIWKHYIKQQEEIKNGKKFKKGKSKILNDQNILIELNSKEKIKYKYIYDEYILEQSKGEKKNIDIILDEWQNEAINHIKSGNSCLIKGPTSGGKTYVMMKGLDNIINSGIEQNVVYVSPTFYLAYQTYANTKVTFPNRKIAIITIELIHIPKDANIFIGTACELLNYFKISNKKFQVGIFDEIHVATILYCNYVSTKEKIRARSYAKLISHCEKQIIAASATIRNVDAMRNFIASMINLDNKNKIDYKDIHIVNYDKRIIPLIEYRYLNNSKLKIIKRDENHIEIDIPSNDMIKGDINAENLFKLLIEMRNNDMMPSIIFDDNDDNAWKTYTNLIKYCNQKEYIDYKDYREGLNMINNIITNYNIEYHKINENIIDDIDINSRLKVKKGEHVNLKRGNNKKEGILYGIISKRNNSICKMLSEFKLILKKSIINYNNNNIESLCKILDIPNDIMINILEILEYNKITLYKKYPNFFITQAHIDMINIIEKIDNLDRHTPEILMLFEITKGSFYKFGNTISVELLKTIREPGTDEEKWKHRKRMISLAEAQNIKPKDIDDIIDVIINGMQYGLAIINSSLPFVIQNIILENLKNKEIGIVFASESMSMGINYPLRSVIIKSMSGYEKLLPGKMIQMSGRCGRRGKDNQAHVIFWGIENASQSSHVYIPPVIFPEHFLVDNISNLSGCIITNHEKIAIELGEILLTKYFDNNILNNVKKSISLPNITDVYDDDFDIYEIKTLQKKNHAKKLNKEIYLIPVIKCIANNLEFENSDIEELSSLICKIENDIYMDSFSINSFEKSQHINLLINFMIELHNHYATCSNIHFLNFIEEIVNIFQKCEYKLIKLNT